MKFAVALLQIAPLGNNQSRNLAKGLRSCREAKALGADLAVFPELWNVGFKPSPTVSEGWQIWMNSAVDQRSTFFQGFATLARQLDLNIALNYLEAHPPMPRNTGSVIDRRGNVMPNYSQAFLFYLRKDELIHAHP